MLDAGIDITQLLSPDHDLRMIQQQLLSFALIFHAQYKSILYNASLFKYAMNVICKHYIYTGIQSILGLIIGATHIT